MNISYTYSIYNILRVVTNWEGTGGVIPHDSSCLEVGVTQFHSVKLCEKVSQLESIVSKKEKLEDKLMFYLITRLSHQFQFHWPNNNHLL